MSSLRLLHWNVQLMPKLLSQGQFEPGEIFTDPYKAKLEAMIAAIDTENPDVMVFNEVFSEEARERLVDALKGQFPHYVPAFGPTSTAALIPYAKIQDSGLMLLSKYPLGNINGDNHVFQFFNVSEGDDRWALKGVGLVLIRMPDPIGVVALALTHLQAAYDSDDQYSGVRTAQLNIIEETLNLHVGTQVPGGKFVWNTNVILSGDLNIVGNGLPRAEWESAFSTSAISPTFNEHFIDAWDQQMPVEDPGGTNVERHDTNNVFHRLDYLLIDQFAKERPLAAQHMRLRNRGISDHYAIVSDINRRTPHCIPRDAQLAPNPPSSGSGTVSMTFQYPGTLQWVLFKEAGTYIFSTDVRSTMQLYDVTNISDPLPDFDRTVVDVSQIPGASGAFEGLPPKGRKFCLPNAPFLVRMARDTEFPTGNGRIAWRRCRGRTQLDAIALPSHFIEKFDEWPSEPPPSPNPANANWEEAWFTVYIDALPDQSVHRSAFIVENHSNGALKITLYDQGGNELVDTGFKADANIQLDFDDPGGHKYYVGVKRGNLTQGGFSIRWETDITYLTGVRENSGSNTTKLGLYCLDETGVDIFGSDEIVIDVFENGRLIRHLPDDAPWWDANTGQYRFFAMKPIPFLNSVEVRITELEDIGSDQTDSMNIGSLAVGDVGDDPNSPRAMRKTSVDLGYELWYQLCRSAPGASPTGLP